MHSKNCDAELLNNAMKVMSKTIYGEDVPHI